MTNTHPPVKAVESGGAIGCLLLFGIGWTLFSLMFMVIGAGVYWQNVQEYRQLQAEGVVVTGEVRSLEVDSDDDSTNYYVTYVYTVRVDGDPQQFIQRDSVSKSFYNTLRVESPVKVRYAASNPNLAVLEATHTEPNLWFVVFWEAFSGLFVLIGLGLLYSAFSSALKARRLQELGQFTEGTIFDLWEDTDSDGDRHYYVGYEFRATPTGGLTQTYQQGQRVDKKVYRTLQHGQVVRVRYWQDNPEVCRAEFAPHS